MKQQCCRSSLQIEALVISEMLQIKVLRCLEFLLPGSNTCYTRNIILTDHMRNKLNPFIEVVINNRMMLNQTLHFIFIYFGLGIPKLKYVDPRSNVKTDSDLYCLKKC